MLVHHRPRPVPGSRKPPRHPLRRQSAIEGNVEPIENAQFRAAKLLLRKVAGSIDFNIIYKQEGSQLAAFQDANWGNNPDNGKSTSLYVMTMYSDSFTLKVGMQGLAAQSTREAEIEAEALANNYFLLNRHGGAGIRENNLRGSLSS